MTALLVAIVGPLACAGLVTSARRAASGDRVRALGPRSRWRVPSRWRDTLARALVDADVSSTPEQAVEYWAIGVAAVALLAGAFAPALALPSALAAVVAGPVALASGADAPRTKRSRPHCRSRSNRWRPSCAAAEPSRLRSSGLPPTLVPSVPTSSGCTPHPARAPARRRALRVARRARHARGAGGRGCPVGRLRHGRARRRGDRRPRGVAAASPRRHGRSPRALGPGPLVGGGRGRRAARLPRVRGDGRPRRGQHARSTPASGRVCLVVGLALEGLAALWIRRILRSAA